MSDRSGSSADGGGGEAAQSPECAVQLTARQRQVMRAIAGGYLAENTPMGSVTISKLLPEKLSAASVRNTMAELTALGMLEKPHASAGRIPTEKGLLHFVGELLRPSELGTRDRRSVDQGFEALDEFAIDRALHGASDLLSRYTGQLGFVLTPRLEAVVLRHVSLVRLSSERVLAVLVTRSGKSHQRVIEERGGGDQAELDRAAVVLNERLAGHTLAEIRSTLEQDLQHLRLQASRILLRALELGLRVVDAAPQSDPDLVIATHWVLLDQPEFRDPERVRELFAALETRERLIELLDRLLAAEDVSVTLGEALQEVGLRRCALVAAPCAASEGDRARGAVGVIGPSRMNYERIIPMVGYCSRRVTELLSQ